MSQRMNIGKAETMLRQIAPPIIRIEEPTKPNLLFGATRIDVPNAKIVGGRGLNFALRSEFLALNNTSRFVDIDLFRRRHLAAILLRLG